MLKYPYLLNQPLPSSMPQKTPLYKTGMVFGVFDGLHEGHKHFLNQALKRCERLIVSVTHENVIQTLKGHAPRFSFEERALALSSFHPQLEIILGDPEIKTWSALYKYRPDIVFLGYDQHTLAEKLKSLNIPVAQLDPYLPEKYKSSLLYNRTSTILAE